MSFPMNVHGFNASVIAGVSGKFSIEVNQNTGDTIDRMQSAFDYGFKRMPNESVELITENGRVCFFDGRAYFAFGMRPLDGKEVALISAKCEQSELKREDALKYIDKAFFKAAKKYDAFVKRSRS